MNGVLVQQLWKESLAVGVLTAILGGTLLAWPGPSILVAATLPARHTVDAASEQLAA